MFVKPGVDVGPGFHVLNITFLAKNLADDVFVVFAQLAEDLLGIGVCRGVRHNF